MKIEWTIDAPEKPGFYWAKCEDDEPEIIEVKFHDYGIGWSCINEDWIFDVEADWHSTDMSRAIEPLEVPE